MNWQVDWSLDALNDLANFGLMSCQARREPLMGTAAKTITRPMNGTPALAFLEPFRFTVGQYDRMLELGIITADSRVELLRGYVVTKMSRNPPHDSAVSRINKRLLRILPVDWTLGV